MKLNHIGIPYLALLAFIAGSIFTTQGISWYNTLLLPEWHPSLNMIAFIWCVIYACVAWSMLIVWNKTHRNHIFKVILGVVGVCAALNLLWSGLFFYFHDLAASIVAALVLALFVAILMVLIWPRAKKASILLTPYLAWVLYAVYLTYVVLLANS